MAKIPSEWQQLLQGNYLVGNGSGMPIAGRSSIGPSLFTFFTADIPAQSNGTIPTITWMTYTVATASGESINVADGYPVISVCKVSDVVGAPHAPNNLSISTE